MLPLWLSRDRWEEEDIVRLPVEREGEDMLMLSGEREEEGEDMVKLSTFLSGGTDSPP